ncbi:hypothetical protein OG323_06225 [Streptomyces cyaneofuscatus]|uniref:hypothetical protein n=1 Tax=Streptomyces cyaneofuscatus TaxID=66883 RepID=UPI0038696E19|nr:hypothetical protein OG323_06225 [Streptomyces cyaneofuscatus]
MGLFTRITDTAAEVTGHAALTRDIRNAVEGGDQEAAATFRTGTLAAALTTKGCNARGQEVADYVEKVVAVDGDGRRAGWLNR